MEQAPRLRQGLRGEPLLRGELEERVEIDQLDSRSREELLAADDAAGDPVDLAGVGLVPVMGGILDQLPVFIQQAVVDPPAVDRDPIEPGPGFSGRDPPGRV